MSVKTKPAPPKSARKSLTLHRVRMNWQIYVMLIPVVAFYIVFSYVPMTGIVLAWKRFLAPKGIFGSPWAEWANFREFFSSPSVTRVIRNTVVLSLIKLVIKFPAPIIMAILLNEVVHRRYKKGVQTIVYLPHFISWIIFGSIIQMLLNNDDGVINNIVAALGGSRHPFLSDPNWFYPVLLISELIKDVGWGTIIYLAAIAGVDQGQYEAAKIDGAKRFQCIRHITIPSILPTIVILLILEIGNIMNANFGSIYSLYNANVYSVADVIDTFVYRVGMGGGDRAPRYELATAVGLFKNVINVFLLVSGNLIIKKITGYSMYVLD
ncbi:MAG: ABC transporter permease subunit [Clostridiales bacterium]|jgi:putative aldouronate transport system permease protein|nr:ABC transporter permease subunit [Clostridiales bacterium]